MSLSSLLPDLFLQCGDAGTYLDMGEACAIHEACYDEIRPGGTGYWFSWPMRLGLPVTALVYAHIALLFLSTWLSTLALLSLARQTHKSIVLKIFLAAASFSIHLLFLWPTMFASLADPPAALFMLIGLWLLLLSCHTTGVKLFLFFSAGALSIGLAAWIRAFYFYPLLAGISIGFIGFLCHKNRKLSFFLMLFALVFPAMQVAHTYKTTGKLAYLYSEAASSWNNIHLHSVHIGYDTIFPYYGYFYLPKYCTASRGPIDSVKARDYSSLFCLLGNRLAFYLATYREATYLYPGTKNYLFTNTIENIGDPTYWLAKNIGVRQDIAKDPLGGVTADRMDIKSPLLGAPAYLAQWVNLPSATEYSFSVWLWSDHPGAVEIAFANYSSNVSLGRKTVALTTTPQRFFVSGKTQESGLYSVNIGNPSFADSGAAAISMPGSFYAWGAQLEVGSTMTEYAGVESLHPDQIRLWHPALLALNLIAIAMALLFLVRTRQTLLANPAYLTAVAIVVFSFAQALLIIPEQRFMTTCMIFIWLLATAALLFSSARCAPATDTHNSK